MAHIPTTNGNVLPNESEITWAFYSLVKDIFNYYNGLLVSDPGYNSAMVNAFVQMGFADENLAFLSGSNEVETLVSVEYDINNSIDKIDSSIDGYNTDSGFNLPFFITARTLLDETGTGNYSEIDQTTKLTRLLTQLRKDLTEDKDNDYVIIPNTISYEAPSGGSQVQTNLSNKEITIYTGSSKFLDSITTKEEINKTSYMTAKLLLQVAYRQET